MYGEAVCVDETCWGGNALGGSFFVIWWREGMLGKECFGSALFVYMEFVAEEGGHECDLRQQ